jgi:diguanylate cyclase (GGDEF)-like protein
MDRDSMSGIARLRALPPLTAVTALMFGCGAVLLAMGAVARQPGNNPRAELAELALVSAAMCVWVLARGRRFCAAEALVMTVVQLAVIGCLSWTTHVTIGAFANGTVLPIVGVYVTWFLHPVAGRVVLYLGALWWFVAMLHHDSAVAVPLAASLVIQTLLATEVLSRIKRRMDRLAHVDTLTGMLNRRGINAALDRALERAARGGRPMAVVAIDVDGLREVNNTSGHRAGDHLLESLTKHWVGGLRRGDDLGRTGGDEFLFVLPLTDEVDAQAFVRRLESSSPGEWSAGVAVTEPGDTRNSLVDRADRRMYQAKAARRAAEMPSEACRPSVEACVTDLMNDTYVPLESTTRR